jgi:hypothetical protein
MPTPNWFEALTGFPERDYDTTRSQLAVESDELVSSVNGKRYAIGVCANSPLRHELLQSTRPREWRTLVTDD